MGMSNTYESYFMYNPELRDTFEKDFASGGGDVEFLKIVLNSTDFPSFQKAISDRINSQDTTKEDFLSGYGEDVLTLEYGDYLEIQSSARLSIENFFKLQEEKLKNIAPAVRRIPYHKILNGNFTKINHANITEQEKVFYNVQGLPDEMWDVYIDIEDGNLTGGYKTVYYDLGTKNEQFYTFYIYLKEYSKIAKIDLNPKTHLILFDRDLLGIDTNAMLSKEYEIKVLQEGRVNPWFHMRECARINNNGVISRFEMTIQNYAFVWLYCQNFNTFLSAPRQIGKTYIILHLMAYEYAYASTDFTTLFLHYQYTRCVENKVKCLEIADIFPEFLRIHTVRNRVQKGKEIKRVEPSKKNNSKESKNEQLNNILLAVAISTQESEAAKAGRGKTARFVFFDEFNFVKYIIAAMSGVQFAHSTARDMARNSGVRYGVHYASTAGTLDTKQGREMYDTINNKLKRFDNKLFAMCYDELNEYLKTAKMNFFFVEYGYQELGLSEDWYDERRRSISSDAEFRCDILMEWLSSGKGSLFTQKHIDRINKYIDNSRWETFLLDNMHMIKYCQSSIGSTIEDEIRKLKVIGMGIDVASGGGGDSDNTVFFGFDMETCKPLFEYATNTMLIIYFVPFYKMLCDFIWSINPDCKIISAIEWDGPGKDIIPAIMKDPKYAKTLFRSTTFHDSKLNDNTTTGWTVEIKGDTKTRWGSMTKNRRTWMTEKLLIQLVELQPYTMNSIEVATELKTLTRRGTNNRIEHRSGAHDDRIFARLHGYGMLFDDVYREDLPRHFNFIPDLHKIEMLSMNEHNLILVDKHNEGFIDVEGKVEFKLLDKYDPNRDIYYKEVVATKIIRGVRETLSMSDIITESYNNKELAEALWIASNSMPSNISSIIQKQNPTTINKNIQVSEYDYRDVEYKTISSMWNKKERDTLY